MDEWIDESMSFTKIHIIDQHKCSSIFGWQKPGRALGKPVCPVCSLHHFLYADITKIHKAIFPFESDVGLMLLYDLLSINFLSVDAALSHY